METHLPSGVGILDVSRIMETHLPSGVKLWQTPLATGFPIPISLNFGPLVVLLEDVEAQRSYFAAVARIFSFSRNPISLSLTETSLQKGTPILKTNCHIK